MVDLSKVILGTGSYYSVKSGNTLSVTGDGGNAWGYFGPAYKKLAPKLETYIPYITEYEKLINNKNDLTEDEYLKCKENIENEYIKSYYEIRLKNLDIYELLYLLNQKYGNDIILLCHEPIYEFCHRRLIADYIELKTGIYIPEISTYNDNIIKQVPIRYKKRLKKVMNENIK